jgi:RNA polymerase sigma factor (sigma-70 family)
VAERIDLQRALLGLSRRQRDVVVLRYGADLSEADVAAFLHCSVGTVKTHAHRGLAALRVALEPEPEEESDARSLR